MSTTTNGLPYPESTGPTNQGANDIKALALALESRGFGQRSEQRKVSQAFSGGVATLNFATPFKSVPMVIWSPGNPFGASNQAFSAGLFGANPITATGFSLIVYQIAPTAGWFTGTMDVFYLAIGPGL